HGIGPVSPVRRHKSSRAGPVISRPKIVQPTLRITFFAGELVIVDVGAGDNHFATERVIIRLLLNRAGGIRNYAGGPEMVGEIVVDRSAGQVAPGHALAIEKGVFLREGAAVAFIQR